MKKNKKYIMIIVLAYFDRYVFLTGGLFISFLIPIKHTLLPTGIFLILFALYQLVGYILHFKHIYCSYQDAYHQKMTPHNIKWEDVKKSDAYGIPIVFAVVGTAAIAISFL